MCSNAVHVRAPVTWSWSLRCLCPITEEGFSGSITGDAIRVPGTRLGTGAGWQAGQIAITSLCETVPGMGPPATGLRGGRSLAKDREEPGSTVCLRAQGSWSKNPLGPLRSSRGLGSSVSGVFEGAHCSTGQRNPCRDHHRPARSRSPGGSSVPTFADSGRIVWPRSTTGFSGSRGAEKRLAVREAMSFAAFITYVEVE